MTFHISTVINNSPPQDMVAFQTVKHPMLHSLKSSFQLFILSQYEELEAALQIAVLAALALSAKWYVHLRENDLSNLQSSTGT